MTMLSRRALALTCALAPLLPGCALMGGGGKPVTLYQFGNGGGEAAATAAMTLEKPVVIAYPGSTFQQQSSGDRILTATGNQMAYVAEARWVGSARDMFDAAAIRHVEALSSQIRIVRAGAPTKADYMLVIDVREFDANYASGPEAAPDVVVVARAKLLRISDRVIVGDWPIEQRENAQENRVATIVAAFDRASAAAAAQIAGNVRQYLGAT